MHLSDNKVAGCGVRKHRTCARQGSAGCSGRAGGQHHGKSTYVNAHRAPCLLHHIVQQYLRLGRQRERPIGIPGVQCCLRLTPEVLSPAPAASFCASTTAAGSAARRFSSAVSRSSACLCFSGDPSPPALNAPTTLAAGTGAPPPATWTGAAGTTPGGVTGTGFFLGFFTFLGSFTSVGGTAGAGTGCTSGALPGSGALSTGTGASGGSATATYCGCLCRHPVSTMPRRQHQPEPLHAILPASSSVPPRSEARVIAGRRTVKTAPCPASESTSIEPPCICTMR